MKPRLACLCMLLVLCGSVLGQPSVGSTYAASQIVGPHLIRFSGVLKHNSGKPLTGTVGVMFALYNDQQGGPALWMEIQNVRLDENGKYTVFLGATKADGIPVDLFTSGEAQWVGVTVQGQTEQPRVLLVSVPYALKAAEADTLAGHAVGCGLPADCPRTCNCSEQPSDP